MRLVTMLVAWIGSIFIPSSMPVENTPTPVVLAESQSGYRSQFFHVFADQNLSLIPNFSQQLETKNLMDTHKCLSGINGGFYTEQHKPIGWFVTEGKQISKAQKNSLFNGFLSRNTLGKGSIDYEPSDDDVWSGLQSGPVVFFDSMPVNLELSRDKQARRMLAATTSGGDILFMSFFTNESSLDGPLLAELPRLVYEFEQQHHFGIIAAINLDGGSASAFVNPDIKLSEWQSVGSWWCVQ